MPAFPLPLVKLAARLVGPLSIGHCCSRLLGAAYELCHRRRRRTGRGGGHGGRRGAPPSNGGGGGSGDESCLSLTPLFLFLFFFLSFSFRPDFVHFLYRPPGSYVKA